MYVICIRLAGLGFAQEKDQNSAVQEVEEKIRQNQALLQETTAEPTTEGTTTISNEAKANAEQQVKQTPITFVGDSVLLASANKLREVFPNSYVDGEVGRQLYYSTPIVQQFGPTRQALSNCCIHSRFKRCFLCSANRFSDSSNGEP